MNAIGFVYAEELLLDLGGSRIWSAKGEGAAVSEWAVPGGRVVLSQGADGRLRLYSLAADAERIRPDVILDAIVMLQQPRPPAAGGLAG